jgi:hypothetical protein
LENDSTPHLIAHPGRLLSSRHGPAPLDMTSIHWLLPLNPVKFTAIPGKGGRKHQPVTYKGVDYKSVTQCAAANGFCIPWMRKLLRRAKRRDNGRTSGGRS